MLISNQNLIDRSLISNGYCLPYNPKLKSRSRDMRNNMTKCELITWEYLRVLSKKYKIIFNRQKPIDNYIVDFYCAKLKLVIEIDGEIHNREYNIKYDKERDELLRKYDLTVLRIKNKEIENNFKNVCKRLEEKLKNYLSTEKFLF